MKGKGRFDSKFGKIQMNEQNYRESDISMIEIFDHLKNDVISVATNWNAFAALKKNGSVYTWGCPMFGGDSSMVSENLQEKIIQIASTYGAFAALNERGVVTTWGRIDRGGGNVSFLENVICICSTDSCFAALDKNGTVSCWGDPEFLRFIPPPHELENTKQILSTEGAFAILRQDSSVYAFGYEYYGGMPSFTKQRLLAKNVQKLKKINEHQFCAIKKNGNHIYWGEGC